MRSIKSNKSSTSLSSTNSISSSHSSATTNLHTLNRQSNTKLKINDIKAEEALSEVENVIERMLDTRLNDQRV